MISRVVAIGGLPGSGKSTAGKRVARSLDLVYRAAGDVFRAEARARGMDLAAFGAYAEAHPEVDRALDEAMQEVARPGVLLDGRIQGVLCRRHHRPVYEVVVEAEEATRARRVAHRDGLSQAAALAEIRARAESERKRYAAHYGIRLDDEAPDLRVDSTHLPPEKVAATIVEFLEQSERRGRS